MDMPDCWGGFSKEGGSCTGRGHVYGDCGEWVRRGVCGRGAWENPTLGLIQRPTLSEARLEECCRLSQWCLTMAV